MILITSKRPRIIIQNKILLASSTGYRGNTINQNRAFNRANNLAIGVINAFNKK